MKKNNKDKAKSKTNANTVLNKVGGAVVFCGFCKKPIHVDDFGGIQKDIGLFHGACLIKNEAEKQIKKHKT